MSETPTNPYSAPDAPINTPSQPENQGGADFRFSETWQLAWDTTKAHWLTGSLAVFVLFVMMAVVLVIATLAASPLNLSLTEESFAGSLVSNAVQIILQAPISMSSVWMTYVAVFSFRKVIAKEFSVSTVGKGFEMIGASILIVIVVNLIYFAVALPGGFITGIVAYAMFSADLSALPDMLQNDPATFFPIFGVVFVFIGIPAIYVGLRLLFALYLCAERNLGAVEAVKASWELTRGHALRLFLFYVLVFLIFLAASPLLLIGIALTCGLGILPVTFFAGNLNAALYYYLTRGGVEKS